MSASVTVGFAPATTPLIATGVTSPAGAEADGGEANLFAALLALLTPPSADGDAVTPAGIPAPPTLPEGQAAAPLLDISDLPAVAAAATTTPEGKSLLKDLGAALIAINEALEAGKPVNPALEKKLGEQLDAVAAYLSGLQQPAAPVVAPASAETAGIDLAAPVAAAPSAAPEIPASPDFPEIADLADAPAEAAASAFAPVTAAAEDTAGETPPATVTPPAAVEAKPVPPVLAELGKLIQNLGAELESQLPDLAKQLTALGDKLATGDVADDILDQLGRSRAGKAASPDLEQIVAALGAPAVPKPATPQRPFTIPALQLPDAVAPVADNDATEPVALAAAPTAADAGDTPDVASPTAVHVGRPLEAKPADADPKPAAQAPAPAANAGIADNASTATAPDSGAAGAQIGATPATGTRAIHAAYLAPVQQLNVPQVAFEVVRQFEAGNTRFQIRLDPPELGRIDVKLDMDKTGTINARMVVERPETLDLMQRDHRALQQALQQAGLDSSKTNLEFSLRQNPFARDGGMAGDGRGQQQPGLVADGFSTGESAEAASVSTLYRGTASAGGVNLFV